jgi:cGMP-dependent protein kinase
MKAIYIQTFYQASAFEGKAVRNVLNEKDASKVLDNPFLIKYVKTLKNQNWCFFVSEFINGILLSEYIRMCKPFNNFEITRFYSACFMIMLDALQNIGIIHRDIKQNNIVIEKNGYPKLIDFSCCKKIMNEKTSTLIGTPFFIAPEILKGKKYSYSCDYWSVGVLVYYLFYGDYPFGNKNSQPVDIYQEIINKEVEFRDCKKSEFYDIEISLQKFISCLLEKDESKRINNLNQVKNLEFFKETDFDKIKRQEIKSPFIPEVVKFDYKKELNNCSKPFKDFIEKEKMPNIAANKKSNKVLFNYENENTNESNFNYHINLMKWFEKF